MYFLDSFTNITKLKLLLIILINNISIYIYIFYNNNNNNNNKIINQISKYTKVRFLIWNKL